MRLRACLMVSRWRNACRTYLPGQTLASTVNPPPPHRQTFPVDRRPATTGTKRRVFESICEQIKKEKTRRRRTQPFSALEPSQHERTYKQRTEATTEQALSGLLCLRAIYQIVVLCKSGEGSRRQAAGALGASDCWANWRSPSTAQISARYQPGRAVESWSEVLGRSIRRFDGVFVTKGAEGVCRRRLDLTSARSLAHQDRLRCPGPALDERRQGFQSSGTFVGFRRRSSGRTSVDLSQRPKTPSPPRPLLPRTSTEEADGSFAC